MAESVLKLLKDRNIYIDQLNKDLLENETIIEQTEKELGELSGIVENLESLQFYPEHEALIPLSNKLYMKGKIIHTGECYIHKSSHPDSYVLLNSLTQTIDKLNCNIKSLEKDSEKAKYSQNQLEERKHILIGEESSILDPSNDLPAEIISEKGVAVKVGDFYEILEFEN